MKTPSFVASIVMLVLVSGCSGAASTSTTKDDAPAADQAVDLSDLEITISDAATPTQVLATYRAECPSCVRGDVLALDGNPADAFINTARSAFDLIRSNAGVVNTAFDNANALPAGAANPMALTGWAGPAAHAYHTEVKSAATGLTLASMTLTVIHQYNGQFNGNGRYLSAVTIVPSEVWNAWTIGINASASVTSIANVGTAADPIASMIMSFTIRVTSMTNTRVIGGVLTFRGDSADVGLVGG